MFWTLIALLGCLVYMRGTQRVTERQFRLEAENSRRQEQTYQAMVQHYSQAVFEMQARMDGPAHRGGVAGETVQLMLDSSSQRTARLEAKLEMLERELDKLRRAVAEGEGMNGTLLASISDLHHKFNNLNHAVSALVEH